MENEYDHFVETIRLYESATWLNNYFNILQKMLLQLNLLGDNPQLAMNVTQDGWMNTNIGQRWVSRPFEENIVGFILPLNVDEEKLNCSFHSFFTNNHVNEAKFVLFELGEEQEMPAELFNEWIKACETELKTTEKSGFRRFHSSVFYDAVTHNDFRNEVFDDAFGSSRNRIKQEA
jgi:hypothetical protein